MIFTAVASALEGHNLDWILTDAADVTRNVYRQRLYYLPAQDMLVAYVRVLVDQRTSDY